ncbi:bifunctional diaminohydroxyphosphoribosylaminopyrimidine deaminase/5-amino-6-(5-phosphoribosylamino)uracil reductase RibD [Legionella israelensis]|uniref:Riboflavin biosynthesis protein RibD n=1 Tax=Legionella israelensis TaxID=454 RepID=A0A0W0VK74_9GAMM|nr:bifunctional diaminohydroxyphosphoribosylaminopyrimidine deaminase/5-amino-6-(5-phosphoribosylamino)uracil reductase RibD [Legionella israelensis]KTD20506.1 riboflavin biosynthesis protein RibD [Legionella israelensis]QBS10817.1 bifunctional diaminohydroxyphosphoribosylaminopyrimidine deaminase/5-amino-6-(5-phosphoribosylamino)uracil reductase RibD [Legionella israelensis]QDP72967.1 bifunctional diaminohydroxyphosphoribosylaminopyrimidine deaminase/5-amino-6-(5-phosphoribosylamino)uracil redu
MHKQFLLAALEQAKLGRGLCAPNPSVGAVAVQNGTIIAQAWHRGAGHPHAEQVLMEQFPAGTPDISMYVTLEPCNHWGKTPPCTDAIIRHGIKEVIYGCHDPNPLVARNNTPKTLNDNGVNCTFFSLPEINRFYQSYKYWIKTGKPWVTVKMAQSLDGKIAGIRGERVMLSNSLCHKFTHELRSQADIILTSAQTINRDDPQLNVRLNGQITSKPLAILDRDLSLNPQARALKCAKHCHIFYSRDSISPQESPGRNYYPTSINNDYLDLEDVILQLGGMGYHDVFVEAGGKIFSSLHKSGLVNRTYIYIVPITLQKEATSAYQLDHVFGLAHQISWQEMGNNMIVCMDWMEDSCLQA